MGQRRVRRGSAGTGDGASAAFERLDAANTGPAPSPAAVRLELSPDLKSAEVPFEDAGAIAAYIRNEVDAKRRTFGDFLILTRRKKGRMGPFTEALERARIPYEVSGSGTLVESEYVQAILTLLHSLTHPDDGIALVGVLRGHCFGFRDPQLYEYAWNGGAFRLSVPVPPRERANSGTPCDTCNPGVT